MRKQTCQDYFLSNNPPSGFNGGRLVPFKFITLLKIVQ